MCVDTLIQLPITIAQPPQYSAILIEKMRKKHAEARPEIECAFILLGFVFSFVDLDF